MNEELPSRSLNSELAALIRAHGFPCTVQDGYVLPDFAVPVRLFAEAQPHRHPSQVIISRLNVGVKLPDGRELYECCGDIGQDLDEALQRNLDSFARNSLHPMLAAFNRLHDEDWYRQEEWRIGTRRYRAYLGDFISRNITDGSIFPSELPDVLADIICRQDLREEHHFVRFYYAQNRQRTLDTEFMIDNANLETAQDELAALSWHAADDFYSLRQFILLQRI